MVNPAFFARQPELASATPEQLAAFAASSSVTHLRAGGRLYDVGDAATHVYFLIDGYLTAELPRPGRRSVVFGFGGPQQGSWGARDVYIGCGRTTRTTAPVDTDVVCLPAAVLETQMRVNPRLVAGAVSWFSKVERMIARSIGELGPIEVRRRLCHTLVEDFLCDGFIELPITQAELARILGLSRATVSECMTALVRRKWLRRVSLGRYRVLDESALRHSVEPVREERQTPTARVWPDTRVASDPEELREVPLLAGIPAASLARFASACQVVAVPPGDVLVTQGSRIDECIVLLQGRAGSWVRFDGDRGQRLNPLVPRAAVIGAQGALVPAVAPTEVIAESPCAVAVVPQHALARLVADEPGFGREILRQAALQVNALAEVKIAMSQTSAAGRVARALLEQPADGSSPGWPVTQQQLGVALAMSRQSINYAVAELRAAGLIKPVARGSYRVLDREALAARADPA